MEASRVNWLRSGDQNTRFFHISARHRQAKNKTRRLQSETGEWETDAKRLKCLAVDYYKTLYGKGPVVNDYIQTPDFPRLDPNQIAILTAEVTKR